MWDLRIGKEIRSFDGHLGDVTSLDLSPNQKYLVSGSQDKSIVIWNIQDGEKTFISKFDQPVTNVSFSKYGEYLLISTMGNILYKYFIDWEQEIV
jgi:WD40 repeat protein